MSTVLFLGGSAIDRQASPPVGKLLRLQANDRIMSLIMRDRQR
jgi:hypothetical protein